MNQLKASITAHCSQKLPGVTDPFALYCRGTVLLIMNIDDDGNAIGSVNGMCSVCKKESKYTCKVENKVFIELKPY